MILQELILLERVVNLFSPEEKRKWADKVWQLLQQSYASQGGFKSAANVDELIADSHLWKLVVRGGKLTAVSISKDKFGRKTIAIATDGTDQGKSDFRMVATDDIRLGRAWAELSGKAETAFVRLGAKPISNKLAAKLTGKKILSLDPDGIHYTRLIQGSPQVKAIYGVAQVDADTQKLLDAEGLVLQQLPANVKI